MRVVSHIGLAITLLCVVITHSVLAQDSDSTNVHPSFSPPIAKPINHGSSHPKKGRDFSWKDGVMFGGLQSKKPGLKMRIT